MKFLIDTSQRQMVERFNRPIVAGQLQTPLTGYTPWPGSFACDNGAFSGFNRAKWLRFLKNREQHRERCLWVALPDVVGNARRTLEAFRHMAPLADGWPLALVAQDGLEDLPIEWASFSCLFIGGSTDWKMSNAAADLVRMAKIVGKQVHIGRLNTVDRYMHFEKLGADTCDGTGIVKYRHMLKAIEDRLANGEEPLPLLEWMGA